MSELGEQYVVQLYKNLHGDKAPPLGLKFAKRLQSGQPILVVEKIDKGQIHTWNQGWSNTKVKIGDKLLSFRSESRGLVKANNFDSMAKVMEAVRYFNGREDSQLTFERGEPANCKLERAPTTQELRKLVGDGRSGLANPDFSAESGAGGKIDFRPTARSGDPFGESGAPFWWGVSPAMGRNALFSIGDDAKKLMQELFDLTAKDVTTRDRGYTKPPRLVVQDVERNCNPAFWERYVKYRKQVRSRAPQIERHETKTSPVIAKASKLFGELDESVNEFYLMHGTKPSAAESIAQSDFLVSLAGSHAGTLYGKGVYFAESCTKGDEYASRYESSSYCILLCRVILGKVFYTDAVKPDREAITSACCTEKTHDSCLGDREKCRGTFREFIVYEADAIYPECIIYYTHKAAADDANSNSNSVPASSPAATTGTAVPPPTGTDAGPGASNDVAGTNSTKASGSSSAASRRASSSTGQRPKRVSVSRGPLSGFRAAKKENAGQRAVRQTNTKSV